MNCVTMMRPNNCFVGSNANSRGNRRANMMHIAPEYVNTNLLIQQDHHQQQQFWKYNGGAAVSGQESGDRCGVRTP
ncbi:hypothetical protein C0J52_18062 [Blattella germanica]|nr:hypothetical protein C0J52_18062 [Blattella germanica]